MNPTTERATAPATGPSARTKMIERQGAGSVPFVHRYPEVRGGVCEFCGILDGNVDSKDQYKLCPHYRGMQLMCSYCPDGTNVDDVIYKHILNVYDSPTTPGQLVVVCDKTECVKKHRERFKVNA